MPRRYMVLGRFARVRLGVSSTLHYLELSAIWIIVF
jgi:hypothetical protein